MEIHELISGTLAKLEKGYVPRVQAVNADGKAVPPTSPDAERFCIYGAMIAVMGDTPWRERLDTIEKALEPVAATMTDKEIERLGDYSSSELNVFKNGLPEDWNAVNKCVGFNNVMGQDQTCDLLRRTLDGLAVPA